MKRALRTNFRVSMSPFWSSGLKIQGLSGSPQRIKLNNHYQSNSLDINCQKCGASQMGCRNKIKQTTIPRSTHLRNWFTSQDDKPACGASNPPFDTPCCNKKHWNIWRTSSTLPGPCNDYRTPLPVLRSRIRWLQEGTV
jgi:hypothetical protein